MEGTLCGRMMRGGTLSTILYLRKHIGKIKFKKRSVPVILVNKREREKDRARKETSLLAVNFGRLNLSPLRPQFPQLNQHA
jgi:hypothetical protein